MYLASCIMYPVSCILYRVSCILHPSSSQFTSTNHEERVRDVGLGVLTVSGSLYMLDRDPDERQYCSPLLRPR